jgi:hypothetical protein
MYQGAGPGAEFNKIERDVIGVSMLERLFERKDA